MASPRRALVCGLVAALLACVPADARATRARQPFAPRPTPHAISSHYVVRGAYLPFTGDFDCNGRADIFWYAPGRAPDYVWYSTANGFVSHEYTVDGVYRPIVGDFDRDRCSDVFWYAPGNEVDRLWFGGASKRFATTSEHIYGSYTPIAGDFDGDGRTDIWWFNRYIVQNWIWSSTGRGTFASNPVDAKALSAIGGERSAIRPIVTDLDVNGRSDVVMYRPGSFRAAYLFGGPHRGVFSVHVGDTPGDDLVPLAGNFTGNVEGSNDEIIWYGRGDEPDYLWWNGSAYDPGPFPFIRERTKITGTSYDPLVGDFNGTARDDILWYEPGVGGRLFFAVPHEMPLAGPPYITGIAAGGEHGCAVVDAVVKCWGANRFGELGNGTKQPSYLPTSVSGVLYPTDVFAGFGYSCAIGADGGAWCWGLNNYGQLGDGTTTSRTTPVRVKGLGADVSAIALSDDYTGREHTCAIAAGAAYCWGYNGDGELGDGTTTSRSAPVAVHGLDSLVTSITAGDRASCAVINFVAKCWGANDSGQLGTGNTTPSLLPVTVTGLTHPTTIGAGPAFACATAVNTAVRCWGDNSDGQLGTGDKTPHLAPVGALVVSNLNGSLTVGFDAACVIHADSAYCWGLSFDSTPKHIVGLTSVATISANVAKCAITARNDAVCWGPNEKGELGNGVATGGLAFPPGQPIDNSPMVVLHLT